MLLMIKFLPPPKTFVRTCFTALTASFATASHSFSTCGSRKNRRRQIHPSIVRNGSVNQSKHGCVLSCTVSIHPNRDGPDFYGPASAS
jgi:hypothetical protein